MVNKVRGEIAVEVKGVTYALRPTFTAIANVEDALNMPALRVVEALLNNNMSLRQLATVIHVGLEASGDAPNLSVDEIGQALFEDGYKSVVEPVAKFLEIVVPTTEDDDEPKN